MNGKWKTHFGKKKYYKDCNHKASKTKYLKKEKFSVKLKNADDFEDFRGYDAVLLKRAMWVKIKHKKKRYKKVFHQKNRRIVRDFISKGKWNEEIKTHYSSKSLKRLIH